MDLTDPLDYPNYFIQCPNIKSGKRDQDFIPKAPFDEPNEGLGLRCTLRKQYAPNECSSLRSISSCTKLEKLYNCIPIVGKRMDRGKEKKRKFPVLKKCKPVASNARIDSQNALALSRRRITSLVGLGMVVNWKILDNRCIPCQRNIITNKLDMECRIYCYEASNDYICTCIHS